MYITAHIHRLTHTYTHTQGTMAEINWLMDYIRFDAGVGYRGYLPFMIIVNDMMNFGECSGKHVCGQGEPCLDHKTAERHLPPESGLTNVIVDASVGAEARCQKTDCKSCNKEEGCGWCLGACTQQGGKCMIGDKSGPTFEACPLDIIGRGWQECEKKASDFISVIAGVVVSFSVVALVLFAFLRWVSRRHGSIAAYAKKKRADFNRAGHKLKILPPETARYDQFLVLVAGVVVVILVMQSIRYNEPTCVSTEEHFLDKSSSVYLTVDNCVIRFLDAKRRPYPENQLEALKINFAFQSDPDIKLDAQTCGSNATFVLSNNMPEQRRYTNYFCQIEVIVPGRFIMPSVTIVAVGDNITSVRAGPMDPDSQGFGMNFGPNTFSLVGTYLDVRLENISAKSFQYKAQHGNLLAVDLMTSSRSEFTSDDADMIVTTPQRTSVLFWQKSDNLVCLTGAPGSVYVDNSCKRVCAFRNASAARRTAPHIPDMPPLVKPSRSSSSSSSSSSSPDIYFYTSNPPSPGFGHPGLNDDGINNTDRRQISTASLPFTGKTWKCSGRPDSGTSWNCSIYDPVAELEADRCPIGAKYEYRSQVPNVDGCSDMENCIFEESSKCLCKPGCDMANLNPKGTCDDYGQCCQIICAGYSSADLFPNPDTPRCGITIDPIMMPWCNGTNNQQFVFTSTSGQISLQVRGATCMYACVFAWQV
jgi:hypothetical protein